MILEQFAELLGGADRSGSHQDWPTGRVEAADLQENYTLVTVVPPVVEEAAPAAEAAAEGAAAVQPAAGGEAAGEAAGQEK